MPKFVIERDLPGAGLLSTAELYASPASPTRSWPACRPGPPGSRAT